LSTYQYKVYGLTLSSELELPELTPEHNTDADVDIVFGEVPEHLPEIRGSGVLYEAAYNDFLFKFEGLGRYRVQNGNRIIIQPEKNALPEEIRLFLLGSNIGALLHQRGMLTMHGSAVSDGTITTILTGKSGAGKSSMAAGLQQLGYSVIADDISVICQNENQEFYVEKGIPHIKLWKDVLTHLNEPLDIEKVRPQLEKYRKPVAIQDEKRTGISKIVLLTSSNASEFNYSKILGGEKFQVLRNNTYRLHFIDKLNQTKTHFQSISRLINTLQMFRADRPHSPLKVCEFANYVSENILKA